MTRLRQKWHHFRFQVSQAHALLVATRSVYGQLRHGVKTSGRGTPVISIWPADLKRDWVTEPLKSQWLWRLSHPDGDRELTTSGQLVIPPMLSLVYVRIPRRPVVVQLAWEQMWGCEPW